MAMTKRKFNKAENQKINSNDIPYVWIRKELALDREEYRQSDSGKKVRIIQEWLSLYGPGIVIDGDFGSATVRAVRQFQEKNQLPETGKVDESTFNKLIRPMLQALKPIDINTRFYNDLVIAYAQQHLKQHSREIGGDNRGPWVRLYMKGFEGRRQYWCAGFVSFILKQAADIMGIFMPFESSFSCDVLAERAKNKNIFVTERDLRQGNPPKMEMPSGEVYFSVGKVLTIGLTPV